jgi:hypothetical protein
MECPQISALRAARIARILTLIFLWLAVLVATFQAVSARAQAPDSDRDAVLRQARAYQDRYRTGDLTVVPAYVAMLDAATRNFPQDADVWYAMGVAHLAHAATALVPGGNPADAMAPMQKGPVALWKALQIKPDHADAMAQLGGVQAMLGPVLQRPAMLTRGIAQMNKAVEIAPASVRARLQRAFIGLSLPEELRDRAAEAADLEFLSDAADFGRPGDYVRLLRADLHAEVGERAAAQTLYRFVAATGSTAAARDAQARLVALDAGGVPMSDIKALRSAAGAQCAMCHGRD